MTTETIQEVLVVMGVIMLMASLGYVFYTAITLPIVEMSNTRGCVRVINGNFTCDDLDENRFEIVYVP